MAKQEPVIKTVTMDDERIVEFTGKRKMLKETIIEDGVVKVRFDFVNGETRTFTIPSALILKFAGHGCEQKFGDEISGVEDVEDCIMAIDELAERLGKGDLNAWNSKREANGMAGTSVLAKALVEHSGKPIEAIKAFLATKTQAEKVALRNNAAIRPIIERLEQAKAAKKTGVDTDALLGELSGEGAASEQTETDGGEADGEVAAD